MADVKVCAAGEQSGGSCLLPLAAAGRTAAWAIDGDT